jgi:hypothetical protein
MAARGVDKSPAEIDRALTVLAYYGGNAARASQEIGMSESTLKLWRRETHRDRYLAIAEREAPRLEALAAHQARELILRAGDAEHSLIDRLNDRLADDESSSKELSELAGTLQRVTTSKGINGTKLLELTGRPTQIVEHRDPRQEAAALARRLGVAIESTATEIEPTPLLAQSVESNARGSVVQTIDPTPSD